MNGEPLTVGDVARFCHVSRRTALTWVGVRKLKVYKTPGGHNRVREEDFVDFLKAYRMPIPDRFSGVVHRRRILIVDDDKDVVNSIKKLLEIGRQYEIDTAFDGFDAGRKFLTGRPDLVILDMRMPGIDGFEVAKRIKRFSEGGQVKIVAISACYREEEKDKMLAAGADICVDKPFDSRRFMELINELLQNKDSPSPSPGVLSPV